MTPTSPLFSATVLVLFGVAVLALAAAAAVAFVIRLQRRAFDKRAALIEPWTQQAISQPATQSGAPETAMRETGLDPASRQLRRLLAFLRVPHRMMPAVLVATRPAGAAFLAIALWFLIPVVAPFLGAPLLRLLLAASAGLLGWLLPGMVADSLATRRKNTVVSGLPDALELLVICSEGGLGLADGIDRIVVELRRSQPELAEELSMTAADLKVLPTQDQALARLAERVNAPIVRSVVTSLSQTMRYGTPLAKAMRVVANDLRNEALIRMEERVNKLPALMTIPMILFILPTLLLVVGGPAALQTFDIIARGGS